MGRVSHGDAGGGRGQRPTPAILAGVRTYTIVVAAGGGSRFGTAKQFLRVGGATAVERAIATARETTDGVVVVLPPGSDWQPPAPVVAVAGGATRSDSVRAGLAAVPDDVDVV